MDAGEPVRVVERGHRLEIKGPARRPARDPNLHDVPFGHHRGFEVPLPDSKGQTIAPTTDLCAHVSTRCGRTPVLNGCRWSSEWLAPLTRGSGSHDLFDRELVALRALRDPLTALRRPVAGRPRRVRGLHEGLRPGRIQAEGLESDEVVQLLHDLRR